MKIPTSNVPVKIKLKQEEEAIFYEQLMFELTSNATYKAVELAEKYLRGLDQDLDQMSDEEYDTVMKIYDDIFNRAYCVNLVKAIPDSRMQLIFYFERMIPQNPFYIK